MNKLVGGNAYSRQVGGPCAICQTVASAVGGGVWFLPASPCQAQSTMPMDAFPFLSHKKQQEECRDTLSVVSDVATLLTLLTTEDHAKMLRRRDPQIVNQQVREAVLRRASRIGLLLEDIDGCTGSSLQSTHGKEWDSFLSGGGPPLPSPSLPSPALLSALEDVSRSLRVRRDQYATLEQDDGSSSYSDYSDSRSVSSSSSSSSRTDSEEETSEEEEEDRAARQRTSGPRTQGGAARAAGGAARGGRQPPALFGRSGAKKKRSFGVGPSEGTSASSAAQPSLPRLTPLSSLPGRSPSCTTTSTPRPRWGDE